MAHEHEQDQQRRHEDREEKMNLNLNVHATINININQRSDPNGDAYRRQVEELEQIQENNMLQLEKIKSEIRRLPNAQQSFSTAWTRIAALIEKNKADQVELTALAEELRTNADGLTESAIAGTTLVDAWEAEPVAPPVEPPPA